MLWEERIYGRELTVGVLGDRALPAVEILPAEKDFDYAAKYQSGGARELCPAPITPEQQAEMGALALKLHRTLGLEVYSRTDFLLDGEGRVDFSRMRPIVYDSTRRVYRAVGEEVGGAWSAAGRTSSWPGTTTTW